MIIKYEDKRRNKRNDLKNYSIFISAGYFCTTDTDTDANCRQRARNDAATDSFQTHEEYKTYLSNCKSDGQGCIVASTTCASQSGYLSFFEQTLDTKSKSTCAKGTSATTDAACAKLSCELNVIQLGMQNADCLIIKPCTSYYGTKLSCQNFTGKDKKCFGDSVSEKNPCRNRSCTDLKTTRSDSDCENFLPGCLFNGVGCVAKSAACSAYRGTQKTCQDFKGSTQQCCWMQRINFSSFMQCKFIMLMGRIMENLTIFI